MVFGWWAADLADVEMLLPFPLFTEYELVRSGLIVEG